MKTVISNPPFNLKWEYPVFAQVQNRFNKTVLPPESNANYAFILTALENNDKAIFILPNGVLTTNNSQEKAIIKYIVDNNLLEAIVLNPDKMFEATNIPTCIMIFNKNKDTAKIEMINMSNKCDKEIREQRGQFGGKSHTSRVYKKEINVFNDEQIDYVINAIKEHKEEKEFCKSVSIEDIKEQNYVLSPSRYIEQEFQENKTREYDDIIKDLNRVIRKKNNLKLIINDKVANSLGLKSTIDLMLESSKNNKSIIENLSFLNLDILEENFITISKRQNDIQLINNDKEVISEILMFALRAWALLVHHLNNEENIYLAELRDKLLPDLMNGNIDLKNIEGVIDGKNNKNKSNN